MARLEQGDEQITSISEQDMRDIKAALASMPYGGLVHAPAVTDTESLILWLENLAAVLRRQAALAETANANLRTLMQQRSAVRQFLGLND